MNHPSQVYKDLAFCENPLEREQEVEDVKVEKVQSLQEVSAENRFSQRIPLTESRDNYKQASDYIEVKHQEP